MKKTETSIPSIHINLLDQQIDRENIDVLVRFVGLRGLAFLSAVLRETTRPNDAYIFSQSEDIDTTFFDSISRIYALPREMSEHFFTESLLLANSVVTQVQRILQLPSTITNLRNEVAFPPNTITELLAQLGKDPKRGLKKTSPVLSFETIRQITLSVIAATVLEHTRTNKLLPKLRSINNAITDDLYLGDIGETTQASIYSVHDNDTNELVCVCYTEHEAMKLLQNNQHVKKTPFSTRPTKLGFPILTDPRKKSDATAVLKAMIKTLATHGETKVDTYEMVHDFIGIQFVTFNDREQQQVIDRIMSILTTYGSSSSLGSPTFVASHKIEAKRPDKIERGQSSKSTYKRFYVYFPGIVTPLELLFKTIEEYLNAEYHVGHEQPDGTYNGASHQMYELRRISKVASILFPETQYGIDTHAFAQLRFAEASRKLRLKNRVLKND